MKIRTRLVIAVLSLLVSSLLVIGTVTVTAARRGLTRLATQHLSFKAEEIRKYAWNQWDVLVTNGLSDLPLFRDAAREAVRSYAASVVRDEFQLVTAYDHEGRIVFSSSGSRTPFSEDLWSDLREREGIVTYDLNGVNRIGYLFRFDPMGWIVLTSVDRSEFYAEIDEITKGMIIATVITLALAALVLLLIAARLTAPIASLASGMRKIAESREFDARLAIDGSHELRDAALAFNAMSHELHHTYAQLRSIAVSEAAARTELGTREMEALLILGRLSEYNDHETGLHIIRVGLYSLLLAQLLGESPEQRRLLYQAAPLHDVGKIAVPESILLKPGPLAEHEREIMQQHTVVGHRILSDARSPSLQAGAEIALTHHERYDGFGYPRGLRGTDIPLFSRILSVADVFDALTSHRPYKEPWSFEHALELVAAERGKQFDPTVADLFLEHRDEVRDIFLNAELKGR